MLSSDLKFKNVSILDVAKYIKVMYTHEELKKHNVLSCMPRRQMDINGTCRRPVSIVYLDKWNWEKVRPPLATQRKQRIVLALMVTIKMSSITHGSAI